MGRLGWSYPAGCTGTPYDEFPACAVCGIEAGDCDCPECPTCTSVGDPACYEQHGLKPGPTSVQGFLDHIGIEPLSDALRAIDKHNVEHVWLVLGEGRRLYYHSDGLDDVPRWARVTAVGVGLIAWDGSDWEWSTEESVELPDSHAEEALRRLGDKTPWHVLDAARAEGNGALEDYRAEAETEA